MIFDFFTYFHESNHMDKEELVAGKIRLIQLLNFNTYHVLPESGMLETFRDYMLRHKFEFVGSNLRWGSDGNSIILKIYEPNPKYESIRELVDLVKSQYIRENEDNKIESFLESEYYFDKLTFNLKNESETLPIRLVIEKHTISIQHTNSLTDLQRAILMSIIQFIIDKLNARNCHEFRYENWIIMNYYIDNSILARKTMFKYKFKLYY